jgi:8-oxo-dGTP diphosphatase
MESPANAVSVALIRDGDVLLIQRAFEPFAGLWTLPGGRREAGESAQEAAIREVREEVGLVVAGLRPVTTLSIGREWRLAVFASASFTGEVAPSAEVATWQWVSPEGAARLPTTPELGEVLVLALRTLNGLP